MESQELNFEKLGIKLEKPINCLRWSNDGSHIFFVTSDYLFDPSPSSNIWKINTKSKEKEIIFPKEGIKRMYISSFDISPDEKYIVFSGVRSCDYNDDTKMRLYLVNRDIETILPLAKDSLIYNYLSPRFHFSGSKICYIKTKLWGGGAANKSEIAIYNLNNKRHQTIFSEAKNLFWVKWAMNTLIFSELIMAENVWLPAWSINSYSASNQKVKGLTIIPQKGFYPMDVFNHNDKKIILVRYLTSMYLLSFEMIIDPLLVLSAQEFNEQGEFVHYRFNALSYSNKSQILALAVKIQKRPERKKETHANDANDIILLKISDDILFRELNR